VQRADREGREGDLAPNLGELRRGDASIPSNVLTTTPDSEERTAPATRAMKPHSASASVPSTRIRSRTRSGSRSGTSSSSLFSAGSLAMS
jgi:hypothetical protein